MSRLILVLACVACGPRVRPEGPGGDPAATTGGTRHVAPVAARAGGPPVAVGQMCPERAAGRAAVSVVLLGRGLSWSYEPEELDEVVGRGEITDFAVHGWSGKRAGVFTVAGATDLGTATPVAAGGYAGAAVCETPECAEAVKGCGLAVGGLGKDGEALEVKVGGACLDGGRLHVDLDGDGLMESFAVSDFLDPIKTPVEEVGGTPVGAPACTPVFAQANLDPTLSGKGWKGLDLVGVIDLDGDGRFEMVLQLRFAEKRTWAIYSATQIATRIELVAEVEPWGL